MASGIAGVGGDALRTFRDRPAIIVGGAVLGLIGLTVLSRQGGAKPADGETTDPAAGLFPGVDTYGSGIPGSGSVPFGGYPSAGGDAGSSSGIPGSGGDLGSFLPPWGLSCNGEPKPTIVGLPTGSSWDCQDSGWVYVPPPPVAPPGSSTTPKPPAAGHTVRVAKGTIVKIANLRSDGKISSWTDRRATVTATYHSATRIKRTGAKTGTAYWIAKPSNGPFAGRYIRVATSGITYR